MGACTEHQPRVKNGVKILCKCPYFNCNKLHYEMYERKPAEEVPRRACRKHEYCRFEESEGLGRLLTKAKKRRA